VICHTFVIVCRPVVVGPLVSPVFALCDKYGVWIGERSIYQPAIVLLYMCTWSCVRHRSLAKTCTFYIVCYRISYSSVDLSVDRMSWINARSVLIMAIASCNHSLVVVLLAPWTLHYWLRLSRLNSPDRLYSRYRADTDVKWIKPNQTLVCIDLQIRSSLLVLWTVG